MIRVRRAERRGHDPDEETLCRVLAAVRARDDRAGKVAARRQRKARRYFALLASRGGRGETVRVDEDVHLWMACIAPGEIRAMTLRSGRRAWIHMVRGCISVNGSRLAEGDGASARGEETLTLLGRDQAEVLLLDMV
jgi:redox-sensitive bicupin YhaK (pirin superfamily)